MIRYSSYAALIIETNQSAPTKLLCSLAIEYRELQDLRERVRIAEAAARDAPARSKKSGLIAHCEMKSPPVVNRRAGNPPSRPVASRPAKAVSASEDCPRSRFNRPAKCYIYDRPWKNSAARMHAQNREEKYALWSSRMHRIPIPA